MALEGPAGEGGAEAAVVDDPVVDGSAVEGPAVDDPAVDDPAVDFLVVDVLVVGGGPAGLAAAEVAAAAGARVLVAERMPTLGRKLRMAGKSGLNLTHAEPYAQFAARYAPAAPLRPALDAFPPEQVCAWCEGLGQPVFIGSSGRVFPRAMKASPLLRAWGARLERGGVRAAPRWRWDARPPVGGAAAGAWRFETPDGPREVMAHATVLALGGASWPRLGSNGAWAAPLVAAGHPVAPFAPSNVGWRIGWSPAFFARWAGAPLKAVALTVGEVTLRGEAVVTRDGLEGGLIYAHGAALRAGRAAYLDLAPDRSLEALATRLDRPRGKASRANWLRKTVGLDPLKRALLQEGGAPTEAGQTVGAAQAGGSAQALAARIKALPAPFRAPRPIDEAISVAGGLCWRGLDADLGLRGAPGVFACGEMLDWDAPTGGYLLTACLATGRWAGAAAARWADRARAASPP